MIYQALETSFDVGSLSKQAPFRAFNGVIEIGDMPIGYDSSRQGQA